MSDLLPRNGRKPFQGGGPIEYVDVQKGSALLDALSLSSTLTLISTVIWPNLIGTLALLGQLGTMVCFCTLFIRVKEGYLMWQFGPGWVRGKVALPEIETCRVVRRRLAYGWGSCRTQRGWAFNPAGALALEIVYGGGRRLRLGTPRAHELRHILVTWRASF